MSTTGSGKEAAAVSSLNLEPNPFEQSFASTKEPHARTGSAPQVASASDGDGAVGLTSAVSAGGAVSADAADQQVQLQQQGLPTRMLQKPQQVSGVPHLPSMVWQPSELTGKTPLQGVHSPQPLLEGPGGNGLSRVGNSLTRPNLGGARPSIHGPAFSSSTFLFSSSQRPSIQSPPVLTPGGSKRLPPLLLSPQLVPTNDDAYQSQQQPAQLGGASSGALTDTAGHNKGAPGGQSLQGTVQNPPQGFLSYLPRTGLTPNESSMRTGLTPGGSLYPLLPSLSGVDNTPGKMAVKGATTTATGFSPSNSNLNIPYTSGGAQPQSQGSAAHVPNKRRRVSSTTSSNRSHGPREKRKSSSGGSPVEEADGSRDTGGDHTGEEDADEQERKRKEFLERNRVAASKFRRKKKEYIKKMEHELQFYETEYHELGKVMDTICALNACKSDTPLLYLLETYIQKNDTMNALNLVSHLNQMVSRTRYFQRQGHNPIESSRSQSQSQSHSHSPPYVHLQHMPQPQGPHQQPHHQPQPQHQNHNENQHQHPHPHAHPHIFTGPSAKKRDDGMFLPSKTAAASRTDGLSPHDR
ncbi:Sko1p KNAG_0F01370 [Huiozyma naganishii CBS 8797]|uniref:BZIP domain-containing protein n=1 Tax=Huiozyma naganishii (strain ATCC MYA-139 / BCRC 22969 / CBS 8797 / KCTC 17520 / NBRC 10181 / NCYC 3082 / Yp74L-3) TaxID=1071383 RepID=J7R7F7_HUIN7|nr:hypothetical protein KNAG_0F01370 [Kazachstania naganishii CBS 8797]CCK70805.1 hypothetical protein KNAG_0F01370 [Kazachstania naganishii CBS 8797]